LSFSTKIEQKGLPFETDLFSPSLTEETTLKTKSKPLEGLSGGGVFLSFCERKLN